MRSHKTITLIFIAAIIFGPWMVHPAIGDKQQNFVKNLIAAAIERTTHEVVYDPAYMTIKYPGGDVPEGTGVCSDVLIRAYRKVGIDLQVQVHEDMAAHFSAYPKTWGLRKTDTNIDHRRVPNLMVFFKRKGRVLPVSKKPEDYRPGDIVCWDLGGGVTHIGLVTNEKSKDRKRNKIAHNIGAGPRHEDVLFDWKIIGHYRYPDQL